MKDLSYLLSAEPIDFIKDANSIMQSMHKEQAKLLNEYFSFIKSETEIDKDVFLKWVLFTISQTDLDFYENMQWFMSSAGLITINNKTKYNEFYFRQKVIDSIATSNKVTRELTIKMENISTKFHATT